MSSPNKKDKSNKKFKRLIEDHDKDDNISVATKSTKSKSSASTSSTFKRKVNTLKSYFCLGNRSDNECEADIDDPDSSIVVSDLPSRSKLSNIISSKTKKEPSVAWRFFESISKTQVKCRLCGGVYKTSYNTSNMFDHLTRKHQNEIANLENGESESNQDSTQSDPIPGSIKNYFHDPYPHNSEKKKNIDQKLALMIAIDFQPLSIVENKGFRNFVAELNPRYHLVSRKTLTTKILPQCWETSATLLKQKLENCQRNVALTTDAWTSSGNQSYLGITCHFVVSETKSLCSAALDTVPILTDEKSESIKTIVTEVIDDWNIHGKIQCIVTDNAPNMIKAADLLKVRHLPCFAHTLNLVIKNSIKAEYAVNIRTIISTCKTVVTFFHCSPKATRLLRDIKKQQCQEESEPPELVQYIEIRWNTVYHMLKSIHANFKFLQHVKLDGEYNDLILPTKEEIKIIEEIMKILRTFDDITKTVSAEKYVTISLIIPSVHGLQRKLNGLVNQLVTTDAKGFLQIVMKFVQEKLFPYEQRTACRIATLLDPRFKKQAFMTELNCQEAVSACQNVLNFELKRKPPPPPAVSTALASDTCSETENMFDFLQLNAPSTTNVVSGILLLKNYLDRKTISLNENPIEFWLTGDLADSVIAEVAMDYLCIPATSVPVERLFSHAGYIVTNRRSCLKPKHVQMLTFLNMNYEL